MVQDQSKNRNTTRLCKCRQNTQRDSKKSRGAQEKQQDKTAEYCIQQIWEVLSITAVDFLTMNEGYPECVCLFYAAGFDDISDCVDLIICLGGDGTLLYASSLFQVSQNL